MAAWTENSEIYFIRNTKLMFDLRIKGFELVPSSEIRRFINKEDLKLGRWGWFVASVDFSIAPVLEFTSGHLNLNLKLSWRGNTDFLETFYEIFKVTSSTWRGEALRRRRGTRHVLADVSIKHLHLSVARTVSVVPRTIYTEFRGSLLAALHVRSHHPAFRLQRGCLVARAAIRGN